MVGKPVLDETQARIQALEAANRELSQENDHLLEIRQKYELFVNNAIEGVFVAVDGCVVFANQRILEFTGYSEPEILQTPFVEFIFPEDRQMVTERHFKRLQGEDVPPRYPLRVLKKDGTFFWAELSACRVAWEKRPAVLSFVKDVTEQKLSADALREREQFFSDVVSSMADWVWEVDQECRYSFCSENAESVLGYGVGELLGRRPFDFMPRDEASRIEQIFREAVKREQPLRDLENWNIKKSGEMVCLLTNAVPVRDRHGACVGYRGVDKDITEHKRYEETLQRRDAELQIKRVNLEDANTALKVLIKNMESDRIDLEEMVLTNVRQLVIPYLKRLRQTELNHVQKNYLKMLESNLRHIISPFLKRLSSNHIGLSPAELRVANLVKEGKTSKQVAEIMNLSVKTIEDHRKSIRKKLGIHNLQANLRAHLLSYER